MTRSATVLLIRKISPKELTKGSIRTNQPSIISGAIQNVEPITVFRLFIAGLGLSGELDVCEAGGGDDREKKPWSTEETE